MAIGLTKRSPSLVISKELVTILINMPGPCDIIRLGLPSKFENSISVSISAAAIPSIVAFLFEAFNRASELFGILVFCCSHIHNDEPIF